MANERITRSRTSSLASASTPTDGVLESHLIICRCVSSLRKMALTVKSPAKMKRSGTGRKATKKWAAKVDARRPKKPPTAFFYFLEDFRKEYQEQNPDVKSMRDIGKACGEKWKTMKYEEKVHYYDIATEKRAEFDTAIAHFDKKKENGEFDEYDDESEFDE
ncbi:hypothetical protein ACJIZ3_013348 [Penstemon smallii]|uniref:HMG box domain-containing protein n=1 Tax=Penstemon smallii TaxID=265156 RepID=A0ABD3UPL1_9LAMI